MIAWRMGERLFRSRITWVISLIVCCLALGLTLSRGGYIAMAAGVVVVLIVERRSMQKGLQFAMALAVITVGAFATGIVSEAIDDFNRRPDNIGERNDLLTSGIDDFVSSGGLGIGLGAYNERYDAIIHNTGLWFFVEMSLVGVAFLLLIAIVPFRAALRLRWVDPTMGSALLGAHVVMLVASAGIEALYQRPWWIVIGLIAGALARDTSVVGAGAGVSSNAELPRDLHRAR
jgi:O-antigen ligase